MSSGPKSFDRRQVRRSFSRAADGYEAVAVLQREVEDRLLEQLDYLAIRPEAIQQPKTILDIGAGPGRGSAALRQRFPKAQVIAMDIALPMLRHARRRSGWWRPLRPVCADAQALPFADQSIDLVFSSLCLQWVADLPVALDEMRRVLRPGGLMLFSTFGPDTLIELREAFARVDDQPHVSDFAPIQAIGDALQRAGFKDPVIDRDEFNLTYADVPTLMRELRAMGANNAAADRHRGLTGKARMRAVFDAYAIWRDADGRLPSTWEVINAHAWGPEPGQPRRGHASNGEIATFPADRIPIRRKR